MSIGVEGEWTEERRQAFLRYLGRHLVALTGSYRLLDADGQPTGAERPYNYSGCVVSFNATWYVLTAGHAIEDFMAAIGNNQILITGRVLADYFGVGATDQHPVPFDIADAPKVFLDDTTAGLDYALLRLGDMQRQLLQANGILAFPLHVANRPADEEFYRYVVVGFPEERVDLSPTPSHQPANVLVQPHCIPLARLENDVTTTHPRFRGQIVEMGDLQSIVGMSGGPIFGFVNRGTSQDCYLWAVQSRWHEPTQTVYACMLDAIHADAAPKLQQLGDT